MSELGVSGEKKIRKLRGQDLRDAISDWDGDKIIDLSGLDLRGTDFSRMDLCNISFDNADLRGVSFKKTDTFKCSFEGADLRGANLDDFTVDEFKLWGADLRGANVCLDCYPVEQLLDVELDNDQLEELGEIIDKQKVKLGKKLSGKTVSELFEEEDGIKIDMVG